MTKLARSLAESEKGVVTMGTYQILSLLGVPTLVTIIFGLIVKKPLEDRAKRSEEAAQEAKEQSSAIMLGMQALLRDRLLQGYRYFNGRGWADYEDRRNLENLYEQYEKLGENGVMDGFRQRFLSLPTEEQKGA